MTWPISRLPYSDGLTPSAALRSDFVTAAQKARATLPETIVPHAVLDRVLKAIQEVHGK